MLGAGPAISATLIGGEGGLLPPSTSLADASAFYESLEGMLVTVQEAVVVGPTNDFGEIYTVIDNDANRANGVNGAELNSRGALQIEAGAPDFGNIDLAGGDFNPERLQIDDDNGVLAGFISPGAQRRRAARPTSPASSITTSATTRWSRRRPSRSSRRARW